MLLWREYPDPASVPNMSLREALRLVGGKREGRAQADTANDRVTAHTAELMVRGLTAMEETLRFMAGAVEAEGFTRHSANVRKIRTLRGRVANARSHFVRQLPSEALIGCSPPYGDGPVTRSN